MFAWMQSLLTSAQPYLHSQTFWTGAAALGGIGGLLVITLQIYDARRLAAFELLRTEFDHFESNELLRVRSDVARSLLAKTNVKAMDESGCTIATQFERLGFLCKGGLVPPDFIWELFSQGTIQYWHILREYIEQVRRGDDTIAAPKSSVTIGLIGHPLGNEATQPVSQANGGMDLPPEVASAFVPKGWKSETSECDVVKTRAAMFAMLEEIKNKQEKGESIEWGWSG